MNLWPRSVVRMATARLDRTVAGPARRRVIVVLACVLALDSADKSMIGANATQLESALHIGKTDIGLLLSISSLVGAAATVPAGVYVDRVNRTRLLAVAVAFWAVAMVLSGLSTNFLFLVLTRVGLGCVTAVSGPAIASLIGDYFPERERGRIYGYVLAGELIGAGFGFVIAGQFATLSWRAPFFVLVAPTVLAWWLVRRLPEPARGGGSRLPPGAEEIRSAETIDTGEHEPYAPDDGAPTDQDEAEPARTGGGLAHDLADELPIEPREKDILKQDPGRMSLWQAARFILTIRTNVVLIVASALGYFYFSGMQGFAVEFAKKHYSLSQSAATSLTIVLGVGALVGVLAGGRLADRLLRAGRLTGRIDVGGVSVLCAGVVFVPALITKSVGIALPLLMVAALFLGATNPPMDAARLDIMHPQLWGRAEATRSVLRNAGTAMAPLLFGVLAQTVFGGDNGLEYAFLTCLTALFASAVITLVFARRTYPGDVAAASRSMDTISAT